MKITFLLLTLAMYLSTKAQTIETNKDTIIIPLTSKYKFVRFGNSVYRIISSMELKSIIDEGIKMFEPPMHSWYMQPRDYDNNAAESYNAQDIKIDSTIEIDAIKNKPLLKGKRKKK